MHIYLTVDHNVLVWNLLYILNTNILRYCFDLLFCSLLCSHVAYINRKLSYSDCSKKMLLTLSHPVHSVSTELCQHDRHVTSWTTDHMTGQVYRPNKVLYWFKPANHCLNLKLRYFFTSTIHTFIHRLTHQMFLTCALGITSYFHFKNV